MSKEYGSIADVKPMNHDQNVDTENPTVDVGGFSRKLSSKILFSSILALAVLGYAGSRANGGQQVVASENVSQSAKTVGILGSSTKSSFGSSEKSSFLLDDSLDVTSLWHDQYLDHIGEDTEHHSGKIETFKQRYLKKSVHWKGPGHPILLIVGGEGSLDPPMLYEFVHEGLAKEFGAFVVSPEHRFYGETHPIKNATVEELLKYLTPDQALADAVNIIQMVQYELGCSTDRTSKKYCPVISFGGSYPGFLSAMLRYRYPDYVDIGYASSAPLALYSQVVNSNAYFDKITEVADIASAGCSNAIRSTLYAVRDDLLDNYTSVLDAAKDTGFCTETFPAYIKDVPEFISEIVTYLVPAIFADFNMAFYPPGPDRSLTRACHIFQDKNHGPMKRITNFFHLRGDEEYNSGDQCLDVTLEMPAGPRSRIRGADSSGSGGGIIGEMWEFQCCKDLIIRAGYSEKSMFLPRYFSYDWHKKHCYERFPGVRVEPFRMAMEWGFNDLSDVTRLMFANGLHDGWSTSSILKEDNPHIVIINFPEGAHHSELKNHYPDYRDTPDIVEGYETIKKTLGGWLDEIRTEHDH